MDLNSLICPERISLNANLKSKKKMLQHIAMLFSKENNEMDQDSIFDALISREKLGPTSVGRGIAIPHCRIDGCTKPLCAIVTLEHPIDYDEKDADKVNLIFSLIVPPESNNKHLEILAFLSKYLMEIEFCELIRKSKESDLLNKQLIQYVIKK